MTALKNQIKAKNYNICKEQKCYYHPHNKYYMSVKHKNDQDP